MSETWKALDDSRYEVSDLGRVRKNGKLKNLTKLKNGYINTRINAKWHGVHCLVLETFKLNPVPSFYNCVDHINQKPWDNRLDNLRWSNPTLNAWNCDKRKGYSYSKQRGKYKATIGIEGKNIHLGYFATEAAARARYLEALADAREVYDPYTIY
jgi:hypothetical protein